MNGNTNDAIGRIKTIRPSAIAPIPRAPESEASATIIFAKSSFHTAKLQSRLNHALVKLFYRFTQLQPEEKLEHRTNRKDFWN